MFILAGISEGLHSQNIKIDSLLNLLKKNKEDTLRVIQANELSDEFWKLGNYDTALIHGSSALTLGTKLNFKKGVAASYNIIGLIYYSQGNYPEALKNHLASLKIKEKTGDKQGIAQSYNNIGITYYYQNNYPEALKNYSAALKIRKEIDDKPGIARCYNNIGAVYNDQGRYPEALENYSIALKIREEIGDKQGIATSYNNIAIICYYQGNYPEALKNNFAALKIRKEIGDKLGLVTSYNNIGSLYLLQGNRSEARKFLTNGFGLASEIGNMDDIKSGYMYFSKLDSLEGNFKSAFVNYKLYIAYRDSLTNEENTKKTVQAQMQYDFDKQQLADSIKNAEHLKQEELKHIQEIQQQRAYTYGGLVGFLLMIVVAGISFRAFKQKQRWNEIITAQKQLVDEKQKEILDSIRYAKRIQQSLLPTEKYIEKHIKR